MTKLNAADKEEIWATARRYWWDQRENTHLAEIVDHVKKAYIALWYPEESEES